MRYRCVYCAREMEGWCTTIRSFSLHAPIPVFLHSLSLPTAVPVSLLYVVAGVYHTSLCAALIAVKDV